MGFPLRSNIFRANTREQDYFVQFPIQVAVLFSPSNREFVAAFREIFSRLDALTGKEVAFFAVLDPPEDWLHAAADREWWRQYQRQIGKTGFSFDDKPLVRELARLFGVRWRDMPAIVVGTNLWTAEFVTAPTGALLIEDQLRILTRLAKEWGRPNIGQIGDALATHLGQTIEYHPPDDALRSRLDTTYAVLDAGESRNLFEQRKEVFERALDREHRTVERQLNHVRRRETDESQGFGTREDLADALIEDAAGRLAHARESLEEESLVMLESSLRIGHLLELMDHQDLGFRFRRGRPLPPNRDEDFTAGAQGAWKSFELEINLSIIQAARNARKIPMPNFFALFDPHPPTDKGKIQMGADHEGRERRSDINQLDWRDKHRTHHRFLPLGEAWHVTNALHNNPRETFDAVITRCLGGTLPHQLLNEWRQINKIRNDASHVRPLPRRDYERLWQLVTQSEILTLLTSIKKQLKGRR